MIERARMEATVRRPGPAAWWEAARPRTLPASVAPVLVGTAASARAGGWLIGDTEGIAFVRFLLAMLVALSLQVAVNYANDWFDGIGGVDTPDRVGPRRLVAAGVVSPSAMRTAMLVAIGVAGVAGLALAALAGWELLLVGAAALLATLGYSGGPRPYASAGMGEVFVFVFFGIVATAGSAYVQDGALAWLPVVVALPMGLLATALLVVNNLRDVPTDGQVGKRTLAVRLGDRATRKLYLALLSLPFLCIVVLAVLSPEPGYLLALLALPLAGRAATIVRSGGAGPQLIAALGYTARTQLVFAVLLTVALVARDGGWTAVLG